MKKKWNAMAKYLDERIATIEKSLNALSGDAKTAATESLNQLKTLRQSMNDLAEDDPDSLDQFKQDVTDALERIDKRMNEFASQIEALQERVGGNEETEEAANKLMGKKAANYLGSEAATHDFCEAMRNSKNGDQFAANWRERLSSNGITIAEGSEDAFLPDAVRGAIQDAWEKPGNWLARLKNTGAKAFQIRLNSSDQADETSRAKGHQKGASKADESLTFVAKKVTPQMIYKKIPIDNMTIFEDDGSLLRYIASELVSQWQIEVERAILVGDGRQNNSPNKISSVEAVVDATNTYVTKVTHSESEKLIDEIVTMLEGIKAEGNITLFISKPTLNQLRRIMLSDTSTPQYVAQSIVAEQLGVAEIITTSLLGDDYLAIAMVLDKYVTVGSINPAFVEWEDYNTNTKYYRVEIPFGGAIEAPKSAAVLLAAE